MNGSERASDCSLKTIMSVLSKLLNISPYALVGVSALIYFTLLNVNVSQMNKSAARLSVDLRRIRRVMTCSRHEDGNPNQNSANGSVPTGQLSNESMQIAEAAARREESDSEEAPHSRHDLRFFKFG